MPNDGSLDWMDCQMCNGKCRIRHVDENRNESQIDCPECDGKGGWWVLMEYPQKDTHG